MIEPSIHFFCMDAGLICFFTESRSASRLYCRCYGDFLTQALAPYLSFIFLTQTRKKFRDIANNGVNVCDFNYKVRLLL